MKMEQACRFRTDDAGYRVCARSQGLTADNESNLGYFNSTMTSLFEKDGAGPRMGQSILSYAVSEENGCKRDLLIAKSTMRSDIKGRASIFTHAYFMGLDDYICCMETDPAVIYGIDTDDMMTAQAGGSELPVKEASQRDGFDLGTLREKYGLTDERYALLLYNVYQAVAGGGSLALLTQASLNQTQNMVREIAYCVAMGLLPSLRWRLTCSSAADTRAAICVSSKTGGGGIGIPLCTFDMDKPDGRLDEDPFIAEFFRHLASSDDESRQQELRKLQDILEQLVPPEYASLEMVATVYHMATCRFSPENIDIYRRVIGNLLLCGRAPAANQHNVNRLLVQMLKNWNAALPKRIMELSVDRCVKQVQAGIAGSGELCSCICRLLRYSRSSEQLELLQKTVKSFDTRYAELVHTLLRGIFADRRCQVDPQTACILIQDMLSSGNETLTGDCVELTTALGAEQCQQLAENILHGVGLRQINLMEQSVLANVLDDLCRSGGALSDDACEILDRNSCIYDGRLLDASVSYMVQVRLRQDVPMKDQCALLARLERDYSAFYADITDALKETGSALWKKYQAQKYLQNCKNYEDVVSARRRYQGATPMDDFEQECIALWMQMLQGSAYQGMPMKNLVPQIERALTALPNGVFSLEATYELLRRQRQYTWTCVTYRTLMDYVLDGAPVGTIQALLQDQDEAVGCKQRFLDALWQLRQDPAQSEAMLELVLDEGVPARDRNEICDLLIGLATKLRASSGRSFIAWDVLLLSCCRVEDGRVSYDCGSLIRKIEGIPPMKMGVPYGQSLCLEYSKLLQDEKLCNELRKAAGRGDSLLSEQLERTLKAWNKQHKAAGRGERLESAPSKKGSIFSLFNRSDKDETTGQQEQGKCYKECAPESEKRKKGRGR